MPAVLFSSHVLHITGGMFGRLGASYMRASRVLHTICFEVSILLCCCWIFIFFNMSIGVCLLLVLGRSDVYCVCAFLVVMVVCKIRRGSSL